MIRPKTRHLLSALTLALALAPAGTVAAPVPSPTASEPSMEPYHLSFAVTQDAIIAASPSTILAIAQEPKRWSPNLVEHDHVAGPAKGTGAVYRATIKSDGSTTVRHERTVAADDQRIVLNIRTDPPFKGTTFAEIATQPEGNATRTSFKIYVDVETAAKVPATMMPAIVQQNETVLAGHLQRIKALAEQSH